MRNDCEVKKKMSRRDFLGVAQSPKSSSSGTVEVYYDLLTLQERKRKKSEDFGEVAEM
jgi:hypothetical protein